MDDNSIRNQLVAALRQRGAHAPADKVLSGIKPEVRGKIAPGFTYSPYQLIEHMRFCTQDILDYCLKPEYQARNWPADYWVENPEPTDVEWERTIAGYFRTVRDMEDLTLNPAINLTDPVPNSDSHTYLREILIVIDHNSYHIGQVVSLLKCLGDPPNGGT